MITFKDNRELSLLEYFQDDEKIGYSKYEMTDTYIKVDMPTLENKVGITIELQDVIQQSRVAKITEFQKAKAQNVKMELSFDVEVDTGDGVKHKYTL